MSTDREQQRLERLVREQQRLEHLVLERPRPRPDAGTTAPRRRGRRRVSLRASVPAKPIELGEGIEERVALRERWSHKQGTAETHEHADLARRRPGSLARLFDAGTIDKDQLAAAEQILDAYRQITATVRVRIASMEARVDGGERGGDGLEHVARVRAEQAYTLWRASVAPHARMILAVIVDDDGLTIAARRHGLGMIKARRLLIEALDLWWTNRRRPAAA